MRAATTTKGKSRRVPAAVWRDQGFASCLFGMDKGFGNAKEDPIIVNPVKGTTACITELEDNIRCCLLMTRFIDTRLRAFQLTEFAL